MSVTLIGQAELGLHEQILQRVFGDRGQRAIDAEAAGPMAHGVKLKIGEGDRLHLAIGRMIVDPVLVAAEPIACIQHRRVFVGGPGQLIQPAARERAEAIEVRIQPAEIVRQKIKREQIAQAAIDGVEIRTRTVGRDVIGTAAQGGCYSRVHG